jgi:hypothetical protein
MYGALVSFISLPCGIYKWVDSSGQTHYSEKMEDADKVKTLPLMTTSLLCMTLIGIWN